MGGGGGTLERVGLQRGTKVGRAAPSISRSQWCARRKSGQCASLTSASEPLTSMPVLSSSASASASAAAAPAPPAAAAAAALGSPLCGSSAVVACGGGTAVARQVATKPVCSDLKLRATERRRIGLAVTKSWCRLRGAGLDSAGAEAAGSGGSVDSLAAAVDCSAPPAAS